MSKSKNGKFEIYLKTTDDDSYFYSDTDYDWYVSIVRTGDELFHFSGHSYSRRGGDTEAGVDTVTFDDENNTVVAKHYDGKIETHELPIKIRKVDKGKAIELSYKDGRTEKRARKAVVIFSKYGQPVVRPLK